MDFLQIHDSRPMTEWEHGCINNLKNTIMTKEDTYTFIDIPTFDTLQETVNYSDQMRFDWLKTHKNGVYLDTDCLLTKRFVPEKYGVPYFPNPGWLDIFLIYCNGATWFFKKKFDKKIRDKYLIDNYKPEHIKEYYGWPQPYMNLLKGYKVIPENVYLHVKQTQLEINKNTVITEEQKLEQLRVELYNLVLTNKNNADELYVKVLMHSEEINRLKNIIKMSDNNNKGGVSWLLQ